MPSATNIADPGLADSGRARVAWADGQMPVLRSIRERFPADMPLAGRRVAPCPHVPAEPAVLARTLAAGGAEVSLCAANPFSTQDEAAAALADEGVTVHAVRGDAAAYGRGVAALAAAEPDLVLDDGADLLSTVAGTPVAAWRRPPRGSCGCAARRSPSPCWRSTRR